MMINGVDVEVKSLPEMGRPMYPNPYVPAPEYVSRDAEAELAVIDQSVVEIRRFNALMAAQGRSARVGRNVSHNQIEFLMFLPVEERVYGVWYQPIQQPWTEPYLAGLRSSMITAVDLDEARGRPPQAL